MSSFTVGADPAMQVTFHSRLYAEDGWLESYVAELVATNLRASVRVENPGYGHPPTQLLQALVPVWRGWEGKKSWLSMDGELEIDATSDRTGHITLVVRIPGYATASPWSAEANVVVEAGQIEAVAHAAEAFFAERAA
jgi:hypothetical protein